MTPYRKRGSVVRWEHGVLVRVGEAGEAREVGEELIAEPIAAETPEEPSDEALLAFVAEVIPSVSEGPGRRVARASSHPPTQVPRYARDDLRVERLVVSEGIAEHEYGDVRWRETTRRVHLSLTNGPNRALLDFAEFDLDTIHAVAKALESPLAVRRSPLALRLAPHVSAALLPSLIGSLELEQMPGAHDGYGAPIVRQRVAGLPPNWFRPTYRLRPIRAWHNLQAVPFGTLDPGAPLAIALLAPPCHDAVRLLCVDGAEVFATTVEVRAIRAAGEPEGWYPYAAGAFGAEMML